MSAVLVVDASAVLRLFLLAKHSEWIKRQIIEADSLHAPLWLRIELANGLRKAIRLAGLQPSQALDFFTSALSLPIQWHETSLDGLTQAIELGARHGISVYDMLYIQLAESLSCPVLTADERLMRAARTANFPVVFYPEESS